MIIFIDFCNPGSRIHVFKYESVNGDFVLQNEEFRQVLQYA